MLRGCHVGFYETQEYSPFKATLLSSIIHIYCYCNNLLSIKVIRDLKFGSSFRNPITFCRHCYLTVERYDHKTIMRCWGSSTVNCTDTYSDAELKGIFNCTLIQIVMLKLTTHLAELHLIQTEYITITLKTDTIKTI